MPNFQEMDDHVRLQDQFRDPGGSVALINLFTVGPEDADQLVQACAEDAAVMRRQPGFISTQLHLGIAGSGMFLNYAVWETVEHTS